METATTEKPAPQKHRPSGKSAPVIMPDRVGLAESKRQDWVVDVPIAHTLQHCLDPSYWAHVAAQMEPLDHIELRAEDGSWIAYLVVRFCERSYARVVLDREVKLDGELAAPAESVKHRVEWKGTQLKHCVIRNSDDKILQQGIRSKPEADRWLIDYEKTVEH